MIVDYFKLGIMFCDVIILMVNVEVFKVMIDSFIVVYKD